MRASAAHLADTRTELPDKGADAPNPVTALLDLAAPDMAAVDALIRERLDSPVGVIPDLAGHLVGAGGKRLRPLLTVVAAQLYGGSTVAHHKLAASVEFIHSATLLHDDVVDQSALRRGRKTANRIWGNASSILVGDFLFARAFNLMVETGSLEALDILAKASSVIAEGEVAQLASLRNVALDEDTYLGVIGAKTAALFAAACEVSPVVSERPEAEREALKTYGHAIGMAFQLVDDALDYGGLSTALGKSVGDDFREGKLTLPVIRALKVADAEERAFWERVMGELDQTDVDLERAVSYLRRADALGSTLAAATDYAESAKTALDVFGDSEWVELLRALADYVVARRS